MSSDLAEALEEFALFVNNAVDADVEDGEDILRVLNESAVEVQSLGFVRMIRDSVEAGVERRLHSAKAENRPPDHVSQNLVEKISRSAEFGRTKRRILDQCRQAADALKAGNKPTDDKERNADCSVAAAWLGQSMSLFPGENILSRAVALLRKAGGGNRVISATQVDVLVQLNQIPAVELGQSGQYTELCRSLEEPLKNPQVAPEARVFLAKMFNAPTAGVTMVTFLTCTEFLKGWSEMVDRMLSGSAVLDLSSESLSDYVLLFRLWHQMLLGLCGVWLRFPENLVSGAVVAVVDMLSGCVRSEVQESYTLGNPVLCLALLDLDAGWFTAWMHGSYSRKKMISAMKAQPAFLRYILRISIYADVQFSAAVSGGEETTGAENLQFSRHERKRALLLYSIRSLSVILQYSAAHGALFPADLFENSNSNLSAASCLSKLIRRRLCDEDAPLPVVLATRKCILCLSVASKKTQSIFLQGEVVEEIRNALAGRRTRREGKLTAVQVLVNLYKARPLEELLSTYNCFVVDHCSSLVRLAVEKDPVAPLNLVLATANLCKQIIVWTEPRELLKKKNFLADLGSLVKEGRIDPVVLLPFLAAFDLPDDSMKRYRRSLFLSDFTAYLAVAIEIGPTVMDCFVKQINVYLHTSGKMNSLKSSESCCSNVQADFVQESEYILPKMPPLLFIVASLPGMSRSCAQSDRFIQFINNFFDQLNHFSASVLAASFGLLTILTTNLDFALSAEHQFYLSSRIREAVISHCCSMNEKDEIVISKLAVGLVQLFLNLKMIGGPKEKNLQKVMAERFPKSVSFLDSNFNSYFQADSSRFLVKQVAVKPEELPKGKQLVNFFLECLVSRQRIAYDVILQNFVSESEVDLGFFPNKAVRIQEWQSVLDYGENLKIVKDRKKSLNEIRNLLEEVPYGPHSGGGSTDWFLASVVLLLELDAEKIVQFLKKFSSFSHSKTVWSYLVGSEAYTNNLIESVLPMTERLLEKELPQVKAALAISGTPLITILGLWLHQCFLNILDWTEVCGYLTVSIVGGIRYQVYFVLAVLKHMEEEISTSVTYSSFPLVLVTGNKKNFKLQNYVSFLKELDNKY